MPQLMGHLLALRKTKPYFKAAMIKSHHSFKIQEKTILERAVLIPPFSVNNVMPDEACFLYTIRGKSRVFGPSQQLDLESNEGIVMKCGTYLNKWLQTTSEPEPCEAIAIHFDEEIIKKAFEGSIPEFIKRNQPENRICIQKVQVDAMVRNYVESLMFYFNNPSLVNDELLYLKVKELVLMLSKTESSPQLMSIFQGIFDPAVFTFKEIVHNNLYENLSLDDWALLTNLSVSTFKRKFADAFGDSPARYVRARKLEKAAEMLKISSKRISDIAYECGFVDVAYFSKSFSNQYNQTPSEYRSGVTSN